MGKVTVRLYNDGDDEQIVDLLDLVFKGWPNYDLTCSPMEHWRWKYLSTGGDPYVGVAVDDGRIIGCNLGYPANVRVSGRLYKCYYACDTVVHPDYRGRRVYTRIVEYVNNHFRELGTHFTYWASSNPIFVSMGKQRRVGLPFKLTNFVRVLDVDKQLDAMPVPYPILTKSGYALLNSLNILKNSLKANTPPERLEIREIDVFTEEINSLTEAVASSHSFTVEKNSEYLNWRYMDPRAGEFKVQTVHNPRNRELLGCCVLRVNRIRRDYPVGFIMELMASPQRLDAVDALIKNAITYFTNQGVNLVNVLVSEGQTHRGVLNRNGFLDSRVEPHVFINPLRKGVNIPQKMDKPGYFMFGDLDSLPSRIPK